MKLTSPAFSAGGSIPTIYTCEGNNTSPPLAWSGAPAGTKSFALIVRDPDAPDPAAPKRTFIHWVLYGLPASMNKLADGAGASDDGVAPGRHGLNDWSHREYGGPCPPIGRHRYFFELYALDTDLPVQEQPTHDWLETAIKGHVLARGELMGTYQKGQK
ncbi:MAG TPA: YbhB/YbcL family Raf kinase inhibitor-like protein [Candidatus Binatia bacterium]